MAEIEPLSILDFSLYELERRAAITSAEYLVLIGEPDYVNEGQQLGLVGVDSSNRPFVDMEGIERRMQDGYGLNANNQGTLIGEMLGIRPRGHGFSIARAIGLSD